MKSDLSDLLREWQPAGPEARNFRRGVWSKIEAQSPAISWWEQALAALARPRVAFTIAAFAVLAAALSTSQITRGAGEDAYLRAVNPYAMAR